MPHKKNPITSENLCGLARLVRSHAGAALENIALWHERDISHSSVERVILPDATILVDFMLARATGLVRGLVVHADRMAENLARSGGLVFSEAVMLALVKSGLGRQRAYEIVQRAALAALGGQGDFRQLLADDPEVKSRLRRRRARRGLRSAAPPAPRGCHLPARVPPGGPWPLICAPASGDSSPPPSAAPTSTAWAPSTRGRCATATSPATGGASSWSATG